MDTDLKRFIDAQEKDFEIALAEIRNGRKQSHWMWYVFPQIAGLGFSDTSKYYAIKNMDEAREYLSHSILGSRLIEISAELLKLDTNSAAMIFGNPDDLKLRSSMTLFSRIDGVDPVFKAVLEKFFGGSVDQKTIQLVTQ
jgi:uncharacterized protein (DUF1810 family)